MVPDSDKKKLVILGAGSHGLEVLSIVDDINRESNRYEVLGFLDDDKNKHQKEVGGVPVMGPLKSIQDFPDVYQITAIQGIYNFWKIEEILKNVCKDAKRFTTLIHPSASVSQRSQIGFDCIIFPHVTIGVNVRVGNHINILPNSVINHDSQIGDYSILTSGICVSGRVSLGKRCYLGSGTKIIQNIQIGEQCLTGIGSVVLNNLPNNSVVAGSPARFLRKTVAND